MGVAAELKAALNAAEPRHLQSHSTMKAAEALLKCLRLLPQSRSP